MIKNISACSGVNSKVIIYCTNFKTFLRKQKMTNFYQLKYSKNHFCINVDQYKRLADKLMVFVREL